MINWDNKKLFYSVKFKICLFFFIKMKIRAGGGALGQQGEL